jgi:hypothetical protein
MSSLALPGPAMPRPARPSQAPPRCEPLSGYRQYPGLTVIIA